MPRLYKVNTTFARLVRYISGEALSSKSF
jgi:hypothetical protein